MEAGASAQWLSVAFMSTVGGFLHFPESVHLFTCAMVQMQQVMLLL